MDAVVYGALEEICSQGVTGLTLHELWSKIQSHLTSNGLPLCSNVKKALWSNLLNIPSLRFECGGVRFDAANPKIQSVVDAEAMELKVVAVEHLLDSFYGIYDIKASDAGISEPQRRVLERLAVARTEGVAQNEIAKELGVKNNYFHYTIKGLESRGLIVRQSTIIRKKEAGNEWEYKQGSIVNTNMLHLHRYAKHLGRLQRLEITKEEKAVTDNDSADKELTTGDGVSEERIKDYVPAIRAICDLLEKTDGKVLVVSDIKKKLGYRNTPGHRAWRNILQRTKDAHLVEEFVAKVNEKEVKCLRLLKNFSTKTCAPKNHGDGDDDLDTEHVKLVKRGQITDQLMELPIEQQIYDMIDAEGSKGLTLDEVYKRLGIKNKRYYPRVLDMVSRFGMHIVPESLNRGLVYRAYTAGNYNSGGSNTSPVKSQDTNDVKSSNHTQAGQPMLPHTIQNVGDHTSKVEAEVNEEHNINDTLPDSRSSKNLQCEENDRIPDSELQIVNVNPESNPVSLEPSSSASPAPRVRRSYPTYPCLGLYPEHSQREQWILEKLQEEKVLIRFELHRLLESLKNLEKEHKVQMDKKTLTRSLNKLQNDGQCKCISFAVPSVTNCGRKRMIDVILHPSVYDAEDLSDLIHDKLRSTERQIRIQSSSQLKKDSKSIPVLNDVERIYTNVKTNIQAETAEAMKNNGFVLAKMVRAKLLHVFLWGYLTRLPGWDDVIVGNHIHEKTNPHSTCKLFDLNEAIKAMPLELFLQVAGSTIKLESMVEKCSNGSCLSDLTVDEYKRLMGTRATGLISCLIDILRRLKLIRLIGGELNDDPVGPHTTLRHSLELKPYIEEPVATVLSSTGVNSFDLRPHVRHDFVLSSRKSVDEYWNTLEYCYAASDPKAALHAFPGSAVHEIFLSRSWASIRVMTAHQRTELFKLVANEDINKKISYKNCEKIAANLNLTLEQVLRVFYDKRQKNKSPSQKRKRSSRRKQKNNENSPDEDSRKLKPAKLFNEEDATGEQNPLLETHTLIDEIDGQKETVDDDLDLIEDENNHSYSAIHDCALSTIQSSRPKRFAWTEDKDRLLVIEYVKHRATLGAKYHRTDWATLPSLPAPPDTCRRRMSTLNRNNQFRKAVMRLCNTLGARYAKHLENSENKMIIQDKNACDLIDQTDDLNIDEQWDDFDNKDIKKLLDDALKYKQIAKLEATKGTQYISKYPQADGGGEQHELDENNVGSSSTPINESKKDGGSRQTSTRRSRARLPKSYVMLMNKVKDFGKQAYESLAVSNAIELFKLVFLSTAKDPEVPNLLAETLRRYSEHDLLIAFNYLRDKNFMVRGSDASNFVLSQQFLHNISSSPFPINTGKRAVKMAKWLHERENDLLDTGVNLSADLQCGDVLQLCVQMCSGELSLFPCLPDEGVGEIEEIKKRKCDDNEVCSVEVSKKPKIIDTEIFSRKEKGFPGIQLFLNCSTISRVDTLSLSRDENVIASCGSNLEYDLPAFERLANAGTESAWEAMTCYARNLASSDQELSPICPNLFTIVYSAIQKAGDQGLSMEGISEIIDVQGEKMAELIVEVLEAFGRAFKVNAYDSVHVVDSLYRSKYLLTSMVSNQHDLDLPESHTNDDQPLKSQHENHEDEGRNSITESSTDVAEVHTSTDEVHHRVTILNNPEEVPQPIREIHCNNETESYKKAKVTSPKLGPHEEKCEFRIDSSSSYKPILPWVNGDGSVNEIVYKGLVRRVLGIVMQNPGILEERVISQMNVLNPQSCRKLLELMILDNHITTRKMYQSISNEPPPMLSRLLGLTFNKPKLVCKEHLFANPKSINYL